MWPLLLLAGAAGLSINVSPQSFPADTWLLGGDAIATPDALMLHPALPNAKGHVSSKTALSIEAMELSLTFMSSCSRTINSQGLAILLSSEPFLEGPLLGVQNTFNGALISVNHRNDEIALYFSDGKKAVSEMETALRCQYTNPLIKNTIHMSLSRSRLSVYSGLDRRLCGTLHFPLNQFHVSVSSMNAAQACLNTVYSLTIETSDSEKDIKSIGRSIGEMDAEFADVIGEIGEMVDEFSGKKAGSLAFVLQDTSRSFETLQKELKRLRETFDSQLKRNEWLLTSVTQELEERRAAISRDISELTKRIEKGELAEKLSRWLDSYSRRTINAEPELTQTLKEVKEQTERVEVYVRKEDKFVWVYALLFVLLLGALIVYLRLRQVTKLHDS